MRILVVGASGLVGAAAIRALAAEGVVVRALRHHREPGCAAEVVAGDLDDPASLAAAVRDVDVVVHAGGAMDLPRERLDAVHAAGTEALATAAAAARVARMVLVSTTAVYPPGRLVGIDEDHPVGPATPYAHAKLAAERRARAHLADRLTVLRAVSVYRSGPCPFVAQARAVLAGPIPDLPAANPPIDLVHADDLAAAIVTAALEASPGGTYHVAGRPAPFRDLVECLADAAGIPVQWSCAEVSPALLELASIERSVAIDRARAALSFRPSRDWRRELTAALGP